MYKKLLALSYIFLIFLLFLYSFTQVDLGLTLSKNKLLHDILFSFQHIGYFNRNLSSTIYISLIFLMYIFYIAFLKLAYSKQIETKYIWKILLISTPILIISYNAFSYDLFNYVFDAKIITHYGQNPYFHKALDYPLDPMLAFMHWTDRTYPYGPIWLLVSVPISKAGSNIFILTTLLFKFAAGLSYLGCIFFIQKICHKFKLNQQLGMVYFGLLPLTQIELVLNAHNDGIMFFLLLASLYFYFVKPSKILSILLYLLSVGIKYVTAFLLPVYIYMFFIKKIEINKIIYFSIMLLSAAFIAVVYRTNFQPWYLIYPIIIFSLTELKKNFIVPTIIVSFAGLLIYFPYLYTGNWNPPIPTIINIIVLCSFALSIIYISLNNLTTKFKNDNE